MTKQLWKLWLLFQKSETFKNRNNEIQKPIKKKSKTTVTPRIWYPDRAVSLEFVSTAHLAEWNPSAATGNAGELRTERNRRQNQPRTHLDRLPECACFFKYMPLYSNFFVEVLNFQVQITSVQDKRRIPALVLLKLQVLFSCIKGRMGKKPTLWINWTVYKFPVTDFTQFQIACSRTPAE